MLPFQYCPEAMRLCIHSETSVPIRHNLAYDKQNSKVKTLGKCELLAMLTLMEPR